MKVISIDNMYEDDGYANLYSVLAALNGNLGPADDMLVAIVPEFRDDGRLDRLDVLTVPREDPGPLHEADMDLMTTVAKKVHEIRQRRAAAQPPVPPSVRQP